MTISQLDILKERRAKLEETINDVLEAGQEFQTRNGRVKMPNLKTLQDELANLEMQIRDLEGRKSGYTDTEILVFRGCR